MEEKSEHKIEERRANSFTENFLDTLNKFWEFRRAELGRKRGLDMERVFGNEKGMLSLYFEFLNDGVNLKKIDWSYFKIEISKEHLGEFLEALSNSFCTLLSKRAFCNVLLCFFKFCKSEKEGVEWGEVLEMCRFYRNQWRDIHRNSKKRQQEIESDQSDSRRQIQEQEENSFEKRPRKKRK